MTHLEAGGRGIVGKWKWCGIDLEEAKSAQGELVKEFSTCRNSNCVLSPFLRPPPLPHEHVMYQKASICVTHWYFSKQPWMFFLGHHKLLPTHDFLIHLSLFQAKLPIKKKKKGTKSHRFMGAGLNLGGGMQSGQSRGRGDGEGPEQKVTLRGEGKADGRQGFFLEGRHSPLPGWAMSQQIPPRLSRPEVGASASSGPEQTISLPPSQASPINQAQGDAWGGSLGLAIGNYRLGQKVC